MGFQEVLKPYGDYFLLDCFAKGGMGEIYRGFPLDDSSRKELIVLKKVRKDMDLFQSIDTAQMFASEIRVTAQMIHPNIVKVVDVGVAENYPYLVQEYVFGKNLKDILRLLRKKNQMLPIPIALYVTEQIANGLHFAHNFTDHTEHSGLGIVHNDLSPDNILLGYDGHIKITDFGIARFKGGDESTFRDVFIGKSSYMAPEQATQGAIDRRTDLFVLGLILWEMLCGRRLFCSKDGKSHVEIVKSVMGSRGSIPAPSTINWRVPPQLDRLVLKMLAFKKEDRFQSAAEVQVGLIKILFRLKKEFTPFDFIHYLQETLQSEIKREKIELDHLLDSAELKSSAVNNVVIQDIDDESLPDLRMQEPLVSGKVAPIFDGMTYKGNPFDFSMFQGKKIWLAFYRYATCPLCCLHLAQVTKYQRRLRDENIYFIAVFESFMHEFIKKNTGKIPQLIDQVEFPLLSDPYKKIYKLYRLKNSLNKVFEPQTVLKFFEAQMQGFKQGPVDGQMGTIPAHFLIDESLRVHKAHYNKNVVDHIKWSDVEDFAGVPILEADL